MGTQRLAVETQENAHREFEDFNKVPFRECARRGISKTRMCVGQVAAQKFAKSKVAVFVCQLCWQNICHTFLRSTSVLPNPPTTSKPVTMPKNPPAPPSQIKTRSKNKHTHPGVPDRAPPRRTSVEVENERAVKAQAKAAQKEERK